MDVEGAQVRAVAAGGDAVATQRERTSTNLIDRQQATDKRVGNRTGEDGVRVIETRGQGRPRAGIKVRQGARTRERANEGRALARTHGGRGNATQVERRLDLCFIKDDRGTLPEEGTRGRDGQRALVDINRTSEGQRTAADAEDAGTRLRQFRGILERGIECQGDLQRHRLRCRDIDGQSAALLVDEAVNRGDTRDGQEVVGVNLTENRQGTDTRADLCTDVTLRAARLLERQVVEGLRVTIKVEEGRATDGDVRRGQD